MAEKYQSPTKKQPVPPKTNKEMFIKRPAKDPAMDPFKHKNKLKAQ